MLLAQSPELDPILVLDASAPGVVRTELDPRLAADHRRAVGAPEILHHDPVGHAVQAGVLAGDVGVGHHQVGAWTATDGQLTGVRLERSAAGSPGDDLDANRGGHDDGVEWGADARRAPEGTTSEARAAGEEAGYFPARARIRYITCFSPASPWIRFWSAVFTFASMIFSRASAISVEPFGKR